MATELEMSCTPDKVRREFTALQAENERLEGQLKTLGDAYHKRGGDLAHERGKIKRLRTALLKVEKNMDIMGGYDGRFTLRKVVRDALKGGE